MTKGFIFSAIGTPLDDQEDLSIGGLRAHLEHHAEAKIDGILVGGTMGAMPLLSERTYVQLIEQTAELWAGRGEILVGVSDMSFARTRARIALAGELAIDGVVALTPWFLPFTQGELVDYFRALANESSKPLYLYDLPQRTGVALEIETVVQLAEHPNIAGIKCSGELGQTRRLIDAVAGAPFRVVVAQAPLIDVLLRAGFSNQLDGVYCIVPRLVAGIRDDACRDDWEAAAEKTQRLNGLLGVLRKYGVFPALTALMNGQGIPGNFAPRPYRSLSPEAREQLLAEPAVERALIAERPPAERLINVA